jgi:flagellar biosynthesis/type III secretory pathway M-ring protein FliF/YscJ
VASLEAKSGAIDGIATAQQDLPKEDEKPLLVDPLADLRERARAMVRAEPERAAMLIRSWLAEDLDKKESVDRG